MADRTYTFAPEQVLILHDLVTDRVAAYKNWIVGAIRRRDYGYADKLTHELAKLEEMVGATNVTVHRELDAAAR